MEIRVVLFLPRDAASVPVSRQVLGSCLRTLGVTEEVRNDIALALTEACANVIKHAGPGDQYEVTASAGDGRCVIEVLNTGDPVPAHAAAGGMPPPEAEHGRGLQIIGAVADDVRLTGGRAGTTVHFEKALRWDPGASGQPLLSAAPPAG